MQECFCIISVFMFAFLSTQECICWLLACKCMSQRLHKVEPVPESVSTSCFSSSQPKNGDKFTSTCISASVLSMLHRARESFLCLALFESAPLEMTHASVIGSPLSESLRQQLVWLTVPHLSVSANRESKLDVVQPLKNNLSMTNTGEDCHFPVRVQSWTVFDE